MNVLLPLLIVALAPDAPIEVRYPEAVTVFHCTFDGSWDENFDDWPDHWTRRKGRGFPHYVDIKIHGQPSPQGEASLRIELDGGAAVAYSPPVKVDPLFGYVLEGYVKTEDLNHDRAYFSVTLLDTQRNRLETFYSRKVRRTSGWQKLRLGPISPGSADARMAVVGLHLQPESGEDIKGAASFDDLWLGRLPQLALKANGPYNFFSQEEQVEVNCVASGLVDLEHQPRVTFQLEDVLGRELARLQRPLAESGGWRVESGETNADTQHSPVSTQHSPLRGKVLPISFPGHVAVEPGALIAKTTWRPPVPGPGFYRVRATMKGRRGLVLQKELTLAVFDSQQIPARGEFGWTLPRGSQPLPLPPLTRLICQAGINWVKYPLWHDQRRGDELIEELITFGEQLGEHGIELVGLLHGRPGSQSTGDLPSAGDWNRPPPNGQSRSHTAAEVFTLEPKVWYPSLEPVISRLATRVRWWQLGDDSDTSFVDYPNLAGKIARVKAELDRIGRDVNLGMGWGWLNELPQAPEGNAPWRFLALSADPPMTHRELATYLDATTGQGNLQRWVVIQPLSKDRYGVEVRATDLVRRMIAAKIHGAEAIFCPDPFSTRRGLLNDDGTPGELLFTWRTAARALGGAEYLGSIQLPRGSPNQIFSRGDDVVMVV
ncbi:MAG: hypothetical protein ACYSWU_24770, partial [Planctomycetota bacterium]